MGGVQTPPDQPHRIFIEAEPDQFSGLVTPEEPVEDGIRLLVGEPQLIFVVDPFDQIRRSRFVDDDLRNAQVLGQSPYLGLEQIPQGVDGGRIIGMPGEVAQESLALVPRAQGKTAQLRRLVEEGDTTDPGRQVSPSQVGELRVNLPNIGIHGRGYLDGCLLGPRSIQG